MVGGAEWGTGPGLRGNRENFPVPAAGLPPACACVTVLVPLFTLSSSLPQPWPLKLGFSSPYEGVLVCTRSVGPWCMSPGAVHAGVPRPWGSCSIDPACPNLPKCMLGVPLCLLILRAEDHLSAKCQPLCPCRIPGEVSPRAPRGLQN